MKWKTIKTEIAYDSPYFKLTTNTVLMPDGTVVTPYYKMSVSDFVVIVPVTNDEQVVFVEQYRYGIDEVSLELPAGSKEKGESSLDTGTRELKEETGYTVGKLETLGSPIAGNPGFNDNYYSILLGTNARKTGEQNLDETEDITVRLIPLAKAIDLALNGEIRHAPTITALFRASFKLQQIDFVP